MELILKTISPVHIGNGEELYALDYVIHNGIYYRITQNQFLKFLVSMNDDTLLGKYAGWIEETQNNLEELKNNEKIAKDNKDLNQAKDYNQRLNVLRSHFNLLKFSKDNQKENQFIDFLKNNCKIQIKTNIQTGNQVRGALKTGTEIPYIPATSIKGSVRTALLYHFLNSSNVTTNKQLIQNQFQQIRPEPNKEKAKKELDNLIDQSCFYCGVEIEKNGQKELKTDDEKFDLMKLVSFSDGMPQNSQNILGLGKVDLYLVKKDIIKGTKNIIYIAGKQKQAPFVEYIKENTHLSTLFSFDINFLFAIKDQIKYENHNSFIFQQNKKQWIGIVEKVKAMFNLDIQELTKDNLENKQKEVLEHILKCVYNFSDAQKTADKQWFENYKEHDKSNTYHSKIESGTKELNKYPQLIRLGYATGFSGMTEILYIKNSNNTIIKELFEEIMLYFKIGNAPNNKGEYTPKIGKFPKSRRFITQTDNILPLGWLSISEKEKPKISIPKPKIGDIIKAKIKDTRLELAYFQDGDFENQAMMIELKKEHKNNPLYQIGQKIKVEYQIQGKDKNKRTVLKFIEFLD